MKGAAWRTAAGPRRDAPARRLRGSVLGAGLLAVIAGPVLAHAPDRSGFAPAPAPDRSAPAHAPDRLDRFREIAPGLGPSSMDSLTEVYALIDGEVAESLASGGPFASLAFLQDRLEAFAEAWGGLSLRILALERSVVAAFSFTELPRGSTVRVYQRRGDGPVPLQALAGEGWPVLRVLPRSREGASQLLLTWEGAPGPDGGRALRFELLREERAGVHVIWNSGALLHEGMAARWYGVRGSDITVRYETRYPGWVPGCEGQSGYEDVYRLAAGASAFARASRRDLHGWHREVHA